MDNLNVGHPVILSKKSSCLICAVLTLLSSAALCAQSLPLLERMTATVSPSYETTVRGAAGAVARSSLVAAMNLSTGHYSIVKADDAGAFEARVFAPGGSSILIKADPDGTRLRDAMEGRVILADSLELLPLVGTVIRVPDHDGSSVSATLSGLSAFHKFPAWVAEARVDKASYARGEAITVEGTCTILGSAAEGQRPEVKISVQLIGLSRADGRGTVDQNTYCSTIMTPTGLPIERSTQLDRFANRLGLAILPLNGESGRLQASFRLFNEIPVDLPDGYYRPLLEFVPQGIVKSEARQVGIASRLDAAGRRPTHSELLPPIRIGKPAPPHLYWTLMANTPSQGTRGVTAVEDRDRFAVASRIAVSSDRFVVPRVDPRTGATILYDLEPFAMTVAVSNKGDPINVPAISFRFPSGSLTVSIKRPNGQTSVIGPAPFRQPRLMGLFGKRGTLDANSIADPFQLTTLDPRFQVTFSEEGPHEISLSGTIEDIWGNVWTGQGTYIVDVARPLEIDSAMIPGTQLEAGDVINPSVQLLPGLPADVEVRFRFARASRRDLPTERTLRTNAGTNGYATLEAIRVPDPGEYRIDIVASYRDAGGHAWVGTRTWGGVIAPRSSLLDLHGRRGVDDQPNPRPAWFSRKQIGLSKDTGGHVNLAFHSGDVQWLAKDDAATLSMGIHDPARLVTPTLLKYSEISEEAITIGELPFHSVGPGGLDPHVAATTENELWAYAYRFVERPRVRVREIIGEESFSGLYWRFNDRYGLQSGQGANGDLPNDFKFQFGGVALYGRALAEPVYSIYGSLFVLIANDDPAGTRVFPPFQGNGAGPSGGPLFKLKNREIEMFFHPTAVRPGTILDLGDVASFAGQIGPMLSSKVEITITSPGGTIRAIRGQANKIGYFYDPSGDFIVDEAGVWKAKVKVTFDGRLPSTSGQVDPPYPTGDVLGSREGEFYFYVVPRDSTPLAIAPPSAATFVRPARGPITFTITPPSGLRDLQMTYTTTMPGFILEEGTTNTLTYTYDAPKLAKDFPNLDLYDDDGFAGADTITMSFLVSGTDASGARKHFARQIVLQGEELQMPDQRLRPRRRP